MAGVFVGRVLSGIPEFVYRWGRGEGTVRSADGVGRGAEHRQAVERVRGDINALQTVVEKQRCFLSYLVPLGRDLQAGGNLPAVRRLVDYAMTFFCDQVGQENVYNEEFALSMFDQAGHDPALVRESVEGLIMAVSAAGIDNVFSPQLPPVAPPVPIPPVMVIPIPGRAADDGEQADPLRLRVMRRLREIHGLASIDRSGLSALFPPITDELGALTDRYVPRPVRPGDMHLGKTVRTFEDMCLSEAGARQYMVDQEDFYRRAAGNMCDLGKFYAFGGRVVGLAPLSDQDNMPQDNFVLGISKYDVCFPVCQEGMNRSTTLYQIMMAIKSRLVANSGVLPPHGAETGTDPHSAFQALSVDNFFEYTYGPSKVDHISAAYAHTFGAEKPERVCEATAKVLELNPTNWDDEQWNRLEVDRRAQRKHVGDAFSMILANPNRKLLFCFMRALPKMIDRLIGLVEERSAQGQAISLDGAIVVGMPWPDGMSGLGNTQLQESRQEPGFDARALAAFAGRENVDGAMLQDPADRHDFQGRALMVSDGYRGFFAKCAAQFVPMQ
jgi:hypothetical protein